MLLLSVLLFLSPSLLVGALAALSCSLPIVGLFASDRTTYLTYYIFEHDLATVLANQTTWPIGIKICPDASTNPTPRGAVVQFNAVIVGQGAQPPAAPVNQDYLMSAWFAADGTCQFPLNLDLFTRHSGGFWGFGGTDTTYIWIGQFRYVAPTVPTVSEPAVDGNLSSRRLIDGFEVPGALVNAGAATGLMQNRDASRHVGGFGLAFRGATGALNYVLPGGPFGPSNASWERLYIRLRHKPTTGTAHFWRTHGGVLSGNNGVMLGITNNGQIQVTNVDSGGTQTVLGTFGALLEWAGGSDDAWHRLDLIVSYGTGGSGGRLTVYLDGALAIDATVATALGGLGTNTEKHNSTDLGFSGGGANDCDLDLDDWMNAAVPVDGGGLLRTDGLDWRHGSSIKPIRGKSFAADHNAGAWPGDLRLSFQRGGGAGAQNANTQQSTTALSILGLTTDADVIVDGNPSAIGCAAFMVTLLSTRGTNSGTLGFACPASTQDLAIVQTGTRAFNSVVYSNPASAPTFPDVTPLEIRHTKGNDAVAGTAATLMAQAELIGTFSKCDQLPAPAAQATIPKKILSVHNSPYPGSQWTDDALAPPLSPYVVKSGTYVGNGAGQDLLFDVPVHFLYIRQAGNTSVQGAIWHPGMNNDEPQWAIAEDMSLSNVDQDPTFVPGVGVDAAQRQYRVRLNGATGQFNQNAITYQYVAVGDPGARYLLTGAFQHNSGVVAYAPINVFEHLGFTPLFMLIRDNQLTTTVTAGLYAQGPSSTANELSRVDGTALANAANMGAGFIQSLTALHSSARQALAFAAWRKADGNGLPGESSVLAIGGWTGDGTASRSVSTGGASGKRPILIMVFGESGVAYFRDVSHTSTNSTGGAGTVTATGITSATIDGFAVGSALNTNGVNYNYLVLFGDATAGNNGMGVNGEYHPVETAPPVGGPWPTNPDPTDPLLDPTRGTSGGGGSGGPAPGTGGPGGGNDFGTTCLPSTTAIANIALSRIGISKQLVDANADVGVEASMVRLHYGRAVTDTLTAFPWPFATRYATLVEITGAAVTVDWTHTYRQPADCIFERRIVTDRGGAVDPTPPPFQLSSDDIGGLLFTNEAAPVVLEYTGRPSCSGASPDSLFQDALAWRLASMIAPSLTRMTDAAVACMKAFDDVLLRAGAVKRPDNPGQLPTVATLDTAAASLAANLQVINRALLRLGAATIASLTERSAEAEVARLTFEDELRAVLRAHPWAFATKYGTLAIAAGTATVAVNDDWQYAYAPLPTDLVFARRLVTPALTVGDPFMTQFPPPAIGQGGRRFNPSPAMFRLGQVDVAGAPVPCLFTTELTAVVEYTARYDGVVAKGDELFLDALAWKLAAAFAPSVAQRLPETVDQQGRNPDAPPAPRGASATAQQLRERARQYAQAMYQQALQLAKAQDANEQQQDPSTGEAPWILGRT